MLVIGLMTCCVPGRQAVQRNAHRGVEVPELPVWRGLFGMYLILSLKPPSYQAVILTADTYRRKSNMDYMHNIKDGSTLRYWPRR